ncbi:hypothetical protein [Paenisporosarcina sp. TG-14]|uniref:hypothetical protein n=1 Tax=Paenisporosarcina sp. TG-14 TaxID=1231057 RepID=UPI00178C2D84|nr:hypothetical protein [Paenisporosarcina sp. TG-14]
MQYEHFILINIGNCQSFYSHGELDFQEEHRGKASAGRASTKDVSTEKQLEKAEARIKYLEVELELLKKLEELEGQVRKQF